MARGRIKKTVASKHAYKGIVVPNDSLVVEKKEIDSSANKHAIRPNVVVYAISKNESKFVERWYRSMSEADKIVVLDTGSTDNTVELLRKLDKVEVVSKIISPWRFDVARNESMKLCPPDADILVCTDLDEIFLEGWREKLDEAWRDAKAKGLTPTTFTYEYVWNFQDDGSDGAKFTYEKIHTPNVCRWEHPVHEVLEYSVEKVSIPLEGVRLEHHADPNKSRGQYLSLLEMSVREKPNDDRNMHYLGREYMFRGRWTEAIDVLMKHLKMPSAEWRPERAASMRFIAKCYAQHGEYAEQERWLWRAINEAPNQREACLELAEFLHARKEWKTLVVVCEICLSRTVRDYSYLTLPEAWGSRPWDLYSVGLWYSGRRKEAIEANQEAMKLAPNEKRLQENDSLMRELMKEDR